jgi:Tfp pilus assembly protein PilX
MPDKKGMVLYLVLVSILVALVLASAILNLLLNQARLSHHEQSRVQAYYAAMAGANYAFARLKTGNQSDCWYNPSTKSPNTYYTNNICKSPPSPCISSDHPTAASCVLIDDSLPHSISQVAITVCGTTGTEVPTCCSQRPPCKDQLSVAPCCFTGGTGPGGTLKISATATYTYTP